MLKLKKTNFWSRRFHKTGISDFEMVSSTALIFHVYIRLSLFFQILSIMLTSKRTDLGFSRLRNQILTDVLQFIGQDMLTQAAARRGGGFVRPAVQLNWDGGEHDETTDCMFSSSLIYFSALIRRDVTTYIQYVVFFKCLQLL